MKTLQVVTFAILVLGLVTTNSFAGNDKGLAFYLLMPYLIMIIIALYRNCKYPTGASHISLFIAASSVCWLTGREYYNAIYHPASSTAGLTFLVMPVMSVVLFLGVYAIAFALLGLRQQKFEASIISVTSFRNVLLLIGLLICLLLYRSCRYSNTKRSTSYEGRDFLSGDITKAKKLGLFVKELNYKVDKFSGSINFHPYVEKGFIYGEDSTEIESLRNTDYPYTLGFQRHAVKDAVIVISKERPIHVNYYGQYLLQKPQFVDTFYFDIKSSGVTLGTIKVWD
ncbi:hypothetical protein [Segetibacter aerophilus]|uniref:Uncharacterized protein n=1 Tax=Segetibacter aerophilus TaxID=670293 RepID=A0A512B7E2_9BACT|nr:hypothetical protein [Segetibacter aerophilus]GEO07883.1 hypothetical protein SAE01_03790 [Segetibacter aerophilus]